MTSAVCALVLIVEEPQGKQAKFRVKSVSPCVYLGVSASFGKYVSIGKELTEAFMFFTARKETLVSAIKIQRKASEE